MVTEQPHLVWVPGLRGPEPQRWPETITGADGKERPTLKKYPLRPDEAQLSLHVLAKLYPPPAPPKEDA